MKQEDVKELKVLRDVLGRLPSLTNQDDLITLLPGSWQPARRD